MGSTGVPRGSLNPALPPERGELCNWRDLCLLPLKAAPANPSGMELQGSLGDSAPERVRDVREPGEGSWEPVGLGVGGAGAKGHLWWSVRRGRPWEVNRTISGGLAAALFSGQSVPAFL